ncbi:uncharacterized protein LOC131651504 [Vicia villosa]|uniref:uncharacterized protein LOC131651504 n=1 Tax=Vicia villosa TaxID=3911 RepID=UPI00273C07FC|nr:uncharacterized protein LOC131651504 [Vicia villosa]
MKKKKRSFHKSPFFFTKIKRKKTCLEHEHEFYLPDDCWEHVFKFLINHKLDFKSLSLVSKQFLSITNRLTFSIATRNPKPCFLNRFFRRFHNLNSLCLEFRFRALDARVASVLRDRPTLKSLSVSKIKLKDTSYVTSQYINSFVSLKGLNCLKFCDSQISNDLLYSIAREGLPLKSFVLDNCIGYYYDGLYFLLSKCNGIQHLGLRADFLKDPHIAELSLFLGGLTSINFRKCWNLTNSALFALVRNCRLLTEVTLESIIRKSVESSDSLKNLYVNPRLKFLSLTHNFYIEDESIVLLASIFPNLEHLDLSYSDLISDKGICQVLSRCPNIRHLNFTNGNKVRGLKMNFIVSQLEVLDLSSTVVDDETLYWISKSCRGLLKLLLSFCHYITEKGVMHVVENCTQLKEVNLSYCKKVNVEVVVSIILSRPSLKKRKLIIYKSLSF